MYIDPNSSTTEVQSKVNHKVGLLGMVVHAFRLSTWEASGSLEFEAHLVYRVSLENPKKKKTNKQNKTKNHYHLLR